jgi:hypothetical protein
VNATRSPAIDLVPRTLQRLVRSVRRNKKQSNIDISRMFAAHVKKTDSMNGGRNTQRSSKRFVNGIGKRMITVINKIDISESDMRLK